MLTPQVYGRRGRKRERQRQKSMTPILKHSNKTDKDWLTSDSATSSETSDVELQENHQNTPKPFKSSSNPRKTLLVEEGDRERTPLALKSSSSSNRQFTSTSINHEKLNSKPIDSVSRKLVYRDQQSREIGNQIEIGTSGLLLSNKAKDKERDQDRDPPIKFNKIDKSKSMKLDRGKENIPPKPSSCSVSNSSDVDYFSATSNSNTSSRSSSRNVSPVRNQRQSIGRSISNSSVEEQTRVRRDGEEEMEMESKGRPSRRLTAKKINYREPAEDEIGRRPSPIKPKSKLKSDSKKKEATQRDVLDKEGEKEMKAERDDENSDSVSIKGQKEDENQKSSLREPSSSSHLLDRNTDEGDEFDASPRKSSKSSSSGRTSASSNHRSQPKSKLPSIPQSRISNSQPRPSMLIQHKQPSDPGLEGWNDDSDDELDLIGPPSSSSDSWKDSTSGEKRKSSGMGLAENIRKDKNEIQRIEKGIKSMNLISSDKLSKTSSSSSSTSRLSAKPSTSTKRTSTSLNKLLTTCHPPQETPLDFEETLNNLLQFENHQGKVGKVIKIGEASYSEVYTIEFQGDEDKVEKTKGKKWKVGQSVLKIIPILNPSKSNGKAVEENDDDDDDEEKPEESEMKDVIKEISIAKELGLKEDEDEWTGFGGFRGAHLVQGSYPTKLMKTWKKYSSSYPKLAINPSPSKFSSDQLFLILHLPFGGKDLENIKLNSWIDSASIFWMTCKTLMNAEKNWDFEHRDLHWGNLLVHFKEDQKVGRRGVDGEEKKRKHLVGSPIKKIGTSFKNGRNLKSPPVKSSILLKKSNGNVSSKGLDQDFESSFGSINHQAPMTIKDLSNPETSRVNVNLIDFSLSRMECNGKIIRNDFEDPCLFQGKGDEQFQVYRDMKTLTDDDWKRFHPVTNVLWLHYLTFKLIHSKGLRSPSSASSTTSKLDLELEKKAYRSLISVRKVMGEGIKYLLDIKRENASDQSLDEEVNKVLNSAGEVWKWAEKKSWWN